MSKIDSQAPERIGPYIKKPAESKKNTQLIESFLFSRGICNKRRFEIWRA